MRGANQAARHLAAFFNHVYLSFSPRCRAQTAITKSSPFRLIDGRPRHPRLGLMRGISFTALLISNLAYWAILALTVAIATITAFVVALVADVDTLPQTLEALKSSEAFDLLNRYLSCT